MSEVTETEDELIARHKKEQRDLIATITGMKKQATKSKKKEVMRKCQELDNTLQSRQKLELEQFRESSGGSKSQEQREEVVVTNDEDEFSPEKLLAQLELDSKNREQEEIPKKQQQPQQSQGECGKKKRNRQKERLAKRDAAIQQMKEEASKEASVQPDLRAIELANIAELCKAAKLREFDILPDGHCLFASISDQLKTRHNKDISVPVLRSKAADHIRKNPDTFAPFLFDEDKMEMRDIKSYTDEIENTALWGGDMEIMALSKEYNCPISVMMSGRATFRVNDEGENPELKLVYYKSSYGLGEHYNSLRDA
ncbi:hypothetical protein BVG19_g2882 [[Candida] boidinii]|nr:hypothetical protein BVG19_g2882 [[Candida] boidinii]OWB52742.1 hypothetical protein B5S27_g4323 [[Candida] boidinii]